ncbi:acyl-CoA synthetase [Rhodococcus sp. DMU1]|uniref:acyl-CoA synthetase n=1 Tax=Rhodococcus sp. DMU1 TaxID=2722825 RepID=UPI00143E0EDC|nr:acyl-CoA synthetase [Rhodococcus sp. DMU1]QIX53500.1 acyl-CoA synthetase [Rhodococcus sp. DMU1]
MTPSHHADKAPDTPAIVMGSSGEVVTFAQLEDHSSRFARALRDRGVRRGDHIAILMENNREYLEVAWAAQRSGLYFTAVNTHLRPEEVQYILDDSGAGALVTSAAMAAVVAGLDLTHIRVRVMTGGASPGFENYGRVLARSALMPRDEEFEGREMLYSSGTTGRPKGVRKPMPDKHFGDPESAPVQIARGFLRYGTPSDTVFLSPAPLYHAAPLVFAMSWHRLGATVVVMEKFDARQCLELIERHRVTDAQFVPTMFVRMLRLPEDVRRQYDLSSLRNAVHGAAPCPIAVKRAMLDWWGPVIHEYYSGTEDVGACVITPQEWLAHPGSVGRPMTECHVVGEDGEELPPGEIGVVYFGGGRPFEYHNDPEKTASVADTRGWRTLGDMGYADDGGYLYLTDRKAHMIVSGGVNIYPQEVENHLAAHPAIMDVAVIGVPDDEMGESVKAVVELVNPSNAGPELEAELIDYCRAALASYKCPRSVDFVDDLPRNPNGKLYKRLLRERYWAGHDTRVV